MKQFIIQVEQVKGHCSCGYQVGAQFTCQGLNTPETPFCGGAYAILFPLQTALHSGAKFHFEENPQMKTGLACPDRGKVVFRITLVDAPAE